MLPRLALAALALVAIAASARPSVAQAWAPRAREGDVTFVVQTIDHLGRVFKDVRFPCCETTNVALVVDANYGLTDRWSISAGLPYVFAKYWAKDHPESPPPPEWLTVSPVDTCRCLHSSFQDAQVGAHYNALECGDRFRHDVGDDHVPSHAYPYVGETIVGFDLKELSVSADAGQQLVSSRGFRRRRYAYTFVERVLGISHNRATSHSTQAIGFQPACRTLILAWRRTYDSVSILPDGSSVIPSSIPSFTDCCGTTTFRGHGASCSRTWDLSSFLKTVSGDNTHDMHVYT